MEFQKMKSIIEGLLFVSGDEGIDAKQIADVLEQDISLIVDLLYEMQTDFRQAGRGIQIIEVAGTFQMATLPEHAPYFERLAFSPARGTLSQAALETLAIVAYRQPITRVDIEEIRGVKSDHALHKLTAKQLIREVGRAEAVGRPILYGTTKQFLEYFALSSLKDLPDAASFEAERDLEEETRLLFDKLNGRQMTFDEI